MKWNYSFTTSAQTPYVFVFLYQTQYKLVPVLKNLVTNVLKLPILLNIQRSGRCSRGRCSRGKCL